MEIVINDQVFYQSGDLKIPPRPDAGVYMRPGPSGPKPKPDDGEKEETRIKEIKGDIIPRKGKATE